MHLSGLAMDLFIYYFIFSGAFEHRYTSTSMEDTLHKHASVFLKLQILGSECLPGLN